MSTAGVQFIECPVCKSRHVPTQGAAKDGTYAATCVQCGHFFKFKATQDPATTITITVDGRKYTVGNEYSPGTPLNSWLRDNRISVGTKHMCYEGGCGACLVEVKLYEPVSEKNLSYAVNSCLVPLYACDGWEISTVDHIGSIHSGLHPIQKQIASYNGSQCGYCTPGQVMNMYALTEYYGSNLTKKIVEDSFDGNICRCTGYRSILDAFKDMTLNTRPRCGEITDMEDFKGKLCKTTGDPCTGKCSSETPSRGLHVVFADAQWFRPTNKDELTKILADQAGKNIRILFGNTSTGVYRDLSPDNYDVVVDVAAVKELYGISFDPTIVLGANIVLSQLIDIFDRVSQEPDLLYLKECSQLLSRVANLPIRNRASWAGNICVKHAHPEFPSDVFVMLHVLNAVIGLGWMGKQVHITDFLASDIRGKVISAFYFETLDADETIKFYKVMPRAQNSHTYVTGGFRVKLDKPVNYLVTAQPVLAYSGIGKNFNRATKTELYLNGKQLGDPSVLKNALGILKSEIVADVSPVLSSVQYRTNLALALFYKFILYVVGPRAGARFKSAVTDIYVERPVSSGQQTYDTNKLEWPVTEPLQKLEANAQATGEAYYVDDMPPFPGQLEAVFVLSTVGNAQLASIDPSEALKIPGVVKVITAKDIKGPNNWCASYMNPEEVLVSDQVLYCGQPVAIVVAESFGIAIGASFAVKVSYTNVQPPLLDLQEAIQKKSFFPKPCDDFIVGDADKAIASSTNKITGTISMGTQYHFHMETQESLCSPRVDGMDVYTCTQWPDLTQNAISQVTKMPKSSINVQVKRLGGAYGGKITRNSWIAAACGICSQLTNRPVKLRLTLGDNMRMMGKRFPFLAMYQVGFTAAGQLNGIKLTYYGDCGSNPNDNSTPNMTTWADNAYNCPNWTIECEAVKTNHASHTATRSPGSLPAIFIMESIMEHVAKSISKDATDVRLLNVFTQGQMDPLAKQPLTNCMLKPNIAALKISTDYSARLAQVQQFNSANRWKKKGMSLVPLKFGVSWLGVHYGCQVAIYSGDGTVAISVGGVELGQGLNTKVSQVCAYEFGIPMGTINVTPTNSFIAANGITTGGSITSENCCAGVIECCKMLLARMAPVKAKMKDPTWLKVVNECVSEGIDLNARFWTNPAQKTEFQYYSYGATITEVELDILTGEHRIDRVDILFDCGQSTNPALDIGQVEGAFVMGLGYWLTEECKYDPTTGALVTDSAWEYKPPSSKDIPVDFRVNLQKKNPNPAGVLGAKACGEPPMCMSCSALFAVKRAVETARKEIGKDIFFPLNGPATVEATQLLCLTDPSQFVLA